MGEPDCNVVVFTKAFGESKSTFTYAALRIGDKWYLTGSRAPQGLSWDDLLTWAKPVTMEAYTSAAVLIPEPESTQVPGANIS